MKRDGPVRFGICRRSKIVETRDPDIGRREFNQLVAARFVFCG
jgi:hypothetical protein